MPNPNFVPALRLTLLSVRAYGSSSLILFVLAAIMGLTLRDVTIAAPMMTVALMFVALAPFADDDRSKAWVAYGMLPVRRRTMLLARYAVLGAASAVLLAALVVIYAASGQLAADPTNWLGSVLVVAGFGTFLAVVIPLIVRYGYARAIRVVALAGALVFVGFLVTGQVFGPFSAGPSAPASPSGGGLEFLAVAAWSPVLLIGALTASYLVAVRILESRDF